MHIDEFISSLLKFHKEGALTEWLKKYILASFSVESLDEIEERKLQLQQQLEIIKGNIVDYEKLTTMDKLKIAREDIDNSLDNLDKYINFKTNLLADLTEIKSVFQKLSEVAKLDQIKEFYTDILTEIDLAYTNNNDIEIATNQIEQLKTKTLETSIEETVSIMDITVKTQENNIEKIDVLIGKLKEIFTEIDSVEV